MKFTLRHLVYIAVFGALWGAIEMTLGAYLHVLLPPGASYLPLVGTAITALGLAVALVGRRFVPQAGSIFMIGVVAALLKLLSVGGVKLGPLLGILIESGLAEVVLLAARRAGRFSFALAGALAVASTLPQKFLFASLFLGRSLPQTYQGMIKEGAGVFALEVRYALVILGLLLLIDLALGGLAGGLAWEVGRIAQVRLARE
jgi:hypothetical protein